MAAVLAGGEGAHLGEVSAAAFWRIRSDSRTRIDVSVPRRRRSTPRLEMHEVQLQDDEVEIHDAIRVTTPARTILDLSPRLADKQLKRSVSNALHSLWATEGQFAETLARHPTAPGAKRIVEAIRASP
jgi:hypothetical protein